jgi:penicillin-binding protein 1A
MIHPALKRRLFTALYLCLVAVTAVTVIWTMRQGWAVYKLRRGVGDTWFLAADGKPWFRMDEQRHDVALDHVSRDLQNAVIAVEDDQFFRHWGISPRGIIRSAIRNTIARRVVQGASTITQQLAKVVYYSGQSSLVRKLPGMAVALKLESRYSKPHLLAAYLSVVATGCGLVGARAAAGAYFSHGLDTLLVAQAAEIAGMIQAPSAYDPRRNPTLAQACRWYVLGRMADQGLLTPAQARAANQSPLLVGRAAGGRRPDACAA